MMVVLSLEVVVDVVVDSGVSQIVVKTVETTSVTDGSNVVDVSATVELGYG